MPEILALLGCYLLCSPGRPCSFTSSEDQLKESVSQGLQSVNLLHVANKQAGKYSGGMKRRLSVAISFVGNPKVVYLDEPSTVRRPYLSMRGVATSLAVSIPIDSGSYLPFHEKYDPEGLLFHSPTLSGP